MLKPDVYLGSHVVPQHSYLRMPTLTHKSQSGRNRHHECRPIDREGEINQPNDKADVQTERWGHCLRNRPEQVQYGMLVCDVLIDCWWLCVRWCLRWCVGACAGVLMCWGTDVVLCWWLLTTVLMCWYVDDMCWCFGVLVLMCWFYAVPPNLVNTEQEITETFCTALPSNTTTFQVIFQHSGQGQICANPRLTGQLHHFTISQQLAPSVVCFCVIFYY